MDNQTGPACKPDSSAALVDVGFPPTEAITAWLRNEVVWPDQSVLETTRLNRLWVGRDWRFTFELMLTFRVGGRTESYPLQGGLGRLDNESKPNTMAKFSSIGLTGLRIESPTLQLWCRTPDCDPALPLIERLCGDSNGNQWLFDTSAGQVLGMGERRSDFAVPLRTTIAGYRTGKRCALRIRRADFADRPGVFIKVFRRFPTEEQRLTLHSLARQLPDASHGFVRVPEILDVWEPEKALVFREVSTSAVPLGHSTDDASRAGDTLAVLHSIPIDPAAHVHSAVDEWHTVARWTNGLDFVQCETRLRETFARVLEELNQRALFVSGDGYVTVHRDYYAAQLMRTDSTVWIVDFDTLGLGHPEVDIATYMAHLVLDECRAGNQSDSLKSASHFVRSYLRRGREFSWPRMQFYFACALVRLGALHLARGLHENVAKKLWSMAEGLLENEPSIKSAIAF